MDAKAECRQELIRKLNDLKEGWDSLGKQIVDLESERGEIQDTMNSLGAALEVLDELFWEEQDDAPPEIPPARLHRNASVPDKIDHFLKEVQPDAYPAEGIAFILRLNETTVRSTLSRYQIARGWVSTDTRPAKWRKASDAELGKEVVSDTDVPNPEEPFVTDIPRPEEPFITEVPRPEEPDGQELEAEGGEP